MTQAANVGAPYPATIRVTADNARFWAPRCGTAGRAMRRMRFMVEKSGRSLRRLIRTGARPLASRKSPRNIPAAFAPTSEIAAPSMPRLRTRNGSETSSVIMLVADIASISLGAPAPLIMKPMLGTSSIAIRPANSIRAYRTASGIVVSSAPASSSSGRARTRPKTPMQPDAITIRTTACDAA